MITSFSASIESEGDPAVWQLTFTSDLAAPTFRLYRDGILIRTIAGTDDNGDIGSNGEAVVEVAGDTFPVFTVVDDDTAAAPDGYPDHVTLGWYAADGPASSALTDYYRVDQYDGAEWNEVGRVPDTGAGYFTWASGTLADDTTHTFRVVPIGRNGNAGTAVTFAMLVVRYPDPPNVTYAFNAGAGTVTITAA